MFRRFLYSLQRFMMGRNGFDRITKYLLIPYCAFVFLGTVLTKVTQSGFVYIFFELLIYATLAYAIFRVLSRNVEARRNECEKFDAFLEKLGRKKKSSGWGQPYTTYNYNDYNTYTPPQKPSKPKSDKNTKYVTCKNCKAVLRLKRRRGIHTAVCPKCGKDVKVISLT